MMPAINSSESLGKRVNAWIALRLMPLCIHSFIHTNKHECNSSNSKSKISSSSFQRICDYWMHVVPHHTHTHTFSSFLHCRISYNKTICLPLWWDALAGDKLCWTTPASVRFMNCVKRIFNCRAQKHFLLQRSHKMRWIFGSGIFPFGTVRKWTMHGQLSSGSVFVYFRMQCAMKKNFHSKWMGCFFLFLKMRPMRTKHK